MLRGLAEVAPAVSMIVAGGESGYGREFFRSIVECGALNVIMPDVKYCGGLGEACAAGRAAKDAGGDVSLHSPSGPSVADWGWACYGGDAVGDSPGACGV